MNIFFVSLGCDKNLVDSEVMLGLLDKKGYQIVDSEEDADIIVVNTCCFIHDAKEESIQTILEMAEYKKEYAGLTAKEITDETRKRNEILAKEIYLSVGRYKLRKKVRMIKKLHEAFKAAMERGVDLNDEQKRNGVFDQATFRVRYLDETPEQLHGTCIINRHWRPTCSVSDVETSRNDTRLPAPPALKSLRCARYGARFQSGQY